jgi:phosphoribosylformylglycinamidine synthase subunit PurQ / glutaminase
MIRIAVVRFPGSNCEAETRDALEAAGAVAEIVGWNAPREAWAQYAGFVLPGGFSYEDRVRAGAIAAQHAVLDEIASAADAGKPVLGICNGAQVLVEAGLVPGIAPGHVEVALAANAAPEWPGYYCEWVHVKREVGSGILAHMGESGHPIPLPVGHGEGRFTAAEETWAVLERQGQVAFRYVTADGGPARGFPANPNGAGHAAAGLCDQRGLVLALMPHPERGAWVYQVPEELPGAWGDVRRAAAGNRPALLGAGPGRSLYESFVATACRAAAGGA